MSDFGFFLLQNLYFMLPGIVANMMPIFLRNHVSFLVVPIDFGWTWKDGRSLFGPHKTWRGVIGGIIGAIVIVFLQRSLFEIPLFQFLSLFPYGRHPFWLVGLSIGGGVFFGDLVKSFFKRRVRVSPEETFIPWDQLDSAIGAIIAISILWTPPLEIILVILPLSFFLHITIRHLGYSFKINEKKW